MSRDNTVGSRSEIDMAYIAGFLDGDGSLMLQLKRRKDVKSRTRFMATVCFYQDSRHAEPLIWIRKILGIGYIFNRNDGMTELRINGYETIAVILRKLLPYIKFKKAQARALLKAVDILRKTPKRLLVQSMLSAVVDSIIKIQSHNYATKGKRSRRELLSVLGLTP